MKALTQPRIAKIAGLRQSHLTYCFPRKADLYVALLEASRARAEQRNGGADANPGVMLSSLFFTPEQTRFFLSILLGVNEDSDLKRALAGHAAGLCREVAAKFGLAPDDARVGAFIDELRGMSIRFLLEPGEREPPATLIPDIARRHGRDPLAFG
ncbi:hypothetical protein A7J57_20500 [Agrobacterium tumefaciens]|uniref:TetR family transcriptional regulator n=2 Tax=Agrobacterium tumefaciens TaxID=358 RepID=A0A176XIN3_AGRTU|nr:hypothetical protein A7J57_20500 [Agrobacterium tumefaciens]